MPFKLHSNCYLRTDLNPPPPLAQSQPTPPLKMRTNSAAPSCTDGEPFTRDYITNPDDDSGNQFWECFNDPGLFCTAPSTKMLCLDGRTL